MMTPIVAQTLRRNKGKWPSHANVAAAVFLHG